MAKVEVKGKHVRVRLKNPKDFELLRIHDVGERGHSKRIAGISKKTGKWGTQAWLFPIVDVRMKRPKTIEIMKRLNVMKKVKEVFWWQKGKRN